LSNNNLWTSVCPKISTPFLASLIIASSVLELWDLFGRSVLSWANHIVLLSLYWPCCRCKDKFDDLLAGCFTWSHCLHIKIYHSWSHYILCIWAGTGIIFIYWPEGF
jgi:hypothetical protein